MPKSKERDLTVEFSRRTVAAAIAGGAIWTGLLGRLFQLQVMESRKYADLAAENRVRLELAPPLRGQIYDRFGVSLAAHRQAGRITLIREMAGDIKATLQKVAALIDLSPARQARVIDEALRKPAFVPVVVADELTYEDFTRMTVYATNLPGIQVEMAATRSYPRGQDFAHVLGYVARASQDDLTRLSEGLGPNEARKLQLLFKHPDMRTGREGIERISESWLRGEVGYRRVVTNAAGRVIQALPSADLAPTPGNDLSITIDAELQAFAMRRFGKESGAATVIDLASGDILALASTPAYDPNDFVNGISSADYSALRQNDRSPLFHKAYDGLYPPGSTIKMVTAMAALQHGVTNPQERIYCNGLHKFGDRTWYCWKKGGHGSVTMHQAIKTSCDTYFYEMANRIGIENLSQTFREFGFGHRWDIGLWGGRSGLVPNDAWKRRVVGVPWMGGETLNVGIGQGQLNASILQLAVMSARIALEGQLITPRLIGTGPPTEPKPAPQAVELDAEMMQMMKAAMYGVTSEPGGTAQRSGDLGLGGPRMAGKTGTAQVRRISTEERLRGVRNGDDIERKLRDHALFVGYAPADAPKYAISVVIEHGGSGSAAAAPVARDILAEALRRQSGAKAHYRAKHAPESNREML